MNHQSCFAHGYGYNNLGGTGGGGRGGFSLGAPGADGRASEAAATSF